MRASPLKTGSSPKELRDLRELKAYMLNEFPVGSRVRHTRGALGTVQSVDVTFPNIDRSFPETHVWVKWDDGGTVDMIPASIDLVEEQQPLFAYAKHAVAYLQKYGNTARHVEAWAFRNDLDPYRLKKAVRAAAKRKNDADLFPFGIAKTSNTKIAKKFIDDEWRETLSANGFYPSGATEERWAKSGTDYYVIIDRSPKGDPFYAIYEGDDVLLEQNDDTGVLENYIRDREELQPVPPVAERGLTEDDIAELKRMNIKAKKAAADQPAAHKEVCAWCGKVMREGIEPLTHSICPDCEGGMRRSKAASLELEASISKTALNIPKLVKDFGEKLEPRYELERSEKASMPPLPAATRNTAEQIIKEISDLDPTPNKEYTAWLTGNYTRGDIARFEDISSRAIPALKRFHSLKTTKKIPNEERDIGRIRGLGALEDLIEKYQQVETISKTRQEADLEQQYFKNKQAELVYDDAAVKVISPKTKETACYFGVNTRWCTAARESTNYFDTYNKQGPLYIVLFKAENKRYQFHFPTGQFMDEQDKQISTWELTAKYPVLKDIFNNIALQTLSELSVSAMAFVKKPTKEMMLKALDDDPSAIKYFPNAPKEVRWKAFEMQVGVEGYNYDQKAKAWVLGEWANVEALAEEHGNNTAKWAAKVFSGNEFIDVESYDKSEHIRDVLAACKPETIGVINEYIKFHFADALAAWRADTDEGQGAGDLLDANEIRSFIRESGEDDLEDKIMSGWYSGQEIGMQDEVAKAFRKALGDLRGGTDYGTVFSWDEKNFWDSPVRELLPLATAQQWVAENPDENKILENVIGYDSGGERFKMDEPHYGFNGWSEEACNDRIADECHISAKEREERKQKTELPPFDTVPAKAKPTPKKKKRSELLSKAAASEWLYHVTFSGYLDSIASRGLVPEAEPGITGGGAKGHVFCSEAEHVSYWLSKAEAWAYDRSDNPAEDGLIPVVIRFPRKDVVNTTDDDVAVQEDTGEGSYVADSVPPGSMEVWDGARWNRSMTVDPLFFVDKEGYIQDPKPKLAAGDTYYHATLAKNIPSIAKQGLKPSEDPNWGGMLGDESYGKVYYTRHPREAMYYAGIVFRQTLENYEAASIPVCLRVRIPKETRVSQSPKQYGAEQDEHWTEVGIPPQNIEVWWHGKWHPIQQVAGWGWEEFNYQYSEDEGVYTDWEGAPIGDTANEAEDEAKRSFMPKTAAKDWVPGTLDENFKPSVGVSGVGRVGQPSRLRSRARRYWVVTYYDGTRSETGYEKKTAKELGHFKTGRAAAEAAVEFAKTKGWPLDGYAQSMLLPADQKTAGLLNRAVLPAALLALMPGAVDPAVSTGRQPAAIVEEKRVGLDELVNAIRRTEGADPELHNPGNLVGFRSGRIMRFETEAQGEHALKNVLNRIADGQNPNFKPDMSLEKMGLIYSNGDPNWAKNIAKILRVDLKTPIGPLIKGRVKVAGAWGERSYDNDSVHDILDSYRTPFIGGLGKGFGEPVPAEEVKTLLEDMDQWIPGIHKADDLERAFGVMVFLATHGVKLDAGHKRVAAEIGRGLLEDEDYLNGWKNPLIRKAKIEDELKLFGG